jgi:hypothetical protein
MPSELIVIEGKPKVILDLEEPAAIAAARSYTVAARKARPELCEQLETITNARVGKEQK